MKSNYSAFLRRMIDKYEGGYGWDKADSGGPTKYGITCFRLAEYRGQKMDSMSRWAPIVQALERPEAEAIYKKYYADACFFDQLKSGVDCAVFDYGVNSGPGRAVSVLKALLKLPAGANATQVVAAANNSDARWLINSICDERLAFMRRLSVWPVFHKGWTARVVDLKSYCLALATHSKVDPAIDLSKVSTPKATNTAPDADSVVLNGSGGSILSGIGAKTAGLSWTFVFAMIAAGIAASLAYVWWSKRKAKKANELIIIPATVTPKP